MQLGLPAPTRASPTRCVRRRSYHQRSFTSVLATAAPPSSPSHQEATQQQEHSLWQRDLPHGRVPAADLWMDAKAKTPATPPEKWKGERPVHRILNSDVLASPKRTLKNRTWTAMDIAYVGVLGGLHLGAAFAPFHFTWPAFATFFALYVMTGCIGITFCYHRQLAHKSFKTPKWLEYLAAYCGAHALQGDPVVWVSSHRYHHQYTDTPDDPHTPYEGFFWSHMGWLMDNSATLQRVSDRNNAADLLSQPFYRMLSKTYVLHHIAAGAALLHFGGLPMFLWGFCFRAVFVYHITWAVNSVCHVWGKQEFNTGDLSRNNLLIGILAFGEGWHNNHHAFEFSARHGLKWWQIDFTYMLVSALNKVGLATNVKLPKQHQMDKMRLQSN